MKKVLIGLGLVVLGIAYAAYQPDRSLAELEAQYATAPSQFLELQGMRVHVRDEGPRQDPNPIVLIHGTAASLHTWDGWVDALKAEHRVIRLDIPGFGLTGPQPQDDYRMARYVETILALLDTLKIPKAIVGGNSLGGEIAWNTALLHPERVSKLILVDSAGYPLARESMPIGFKLATISWLNPITQNTLPRAVIASSVKNVYGKPENVTEDQITRYHDLALRPGNRKALSLRLTEAANVHPQDIPKVKQPTLILWGGQDRLIPPDRADRFATDLANSKLVVFPELGHIPQEEDPKATIVPVLAFLKKS